MGSKIDPGLVPLVSQRENKRAAALASSLELTKDVSLAAFAPRALVELPEEIFDQRDLPDRFDFKAEIGSWRVD